MRPRWFAGIGVVALLLSMVQMGIGAQPARSQAQDFPIANGWFFTQASGEGEFATGRGFSITDAGTAGFWTTFQGLGGVPVLGFPATRRFEWKGFLSQGTQRVILQWRHDGQNCIQGVQVCYVNIFDEMHLLGLDDTLRSRWAVPPHESPDESGLTWDQIVAQRQSWLDANPAIRSWYFTTSSDPLNQYGLPTSHMDTSRPDFDIIRLQRVVVQYWKVTIPGTANQGDVQVALGTDIAKELGILPGSPVTITPELPPEDAAEARAVVSQRLSTVDGLLPPGQTINVDGATAALFGGLKVYAAPVANQLSRQEYESQVGSGLMVGALFVDSARSPEISPGNYLVEWSGNPQSPGAFLVSSSGNPGSGLDFLSHGQPVTLTRFRTFAAPIASVPVVNLEVNSVEFCWYIDGVGGCIPVG